MMDNLPSVLVVDDEKGIRQGTKRVLEGEGYEVTVAENGNEGISLAENRDFDLALIDLKMPDINGIDVLKKVKERHPNTVCFITTAFASYNNAIESTKTGAFDYIPKPFTSEELIQKMRDGYHKRQLLLEEEKWRKEREERLLEIAFEKTRLRTIINSISDGVLVINKDGEAVLFNPAALKFLGLNNITVGEKIIDELHPKISELINGILFPETFGIKSYSTVVHVKTDYELYVDATCSPVPHPDGSLAGVAVVLKDITELKQIEHLKSQFVSMVSHEVKAPIAAVYGFLQIMHDDKIKLNEEQKISYLQRSESRLDGLLKMVNDLLDISRMETKSVKREITDVSIPEIINSVYELFKLQMKENGIKFKFEQNHSEAFIKADRDEISRLFINLFSNAVKYNRKDGWININIEKNENFVVTTIEDSGCGLKPEEKEKLFTEFFRAKNEKTKNISGTGLGLSIVKRIIDSCSGKIEVESEFGVGTTFRIYLPLRK